jgi:hypothetical protein
MDQMVDPSADTGTVRGGVRRWLRLEGLVVLVAALAAFATQDQSWWLVPLILFLPDLFMVGYLRNTRIGAFAYNLGHTYPLPAVVCVLGLWQGQPVVVAIGLLWFAHIGMDRAAGYGLKYPDSFAHTHLGVLRHRKDQPPTAA